MPEMPLGRHGERMQRESIQDDLDFFSGKKVFLTGHSGFKGSWLSRILIDAGAEVTGFSLAPPTSPNLFEISNISSQMNSMVGDIRDIEALDRAFCESKPEIVLHLAAQPLVREGYEQPRYTYETNVMGTVNILECLRAHDCVRSFLNVTTDKVYFNDEWVWGYRETDPLDGYDPYSNSKSCSELVTHSYKNSFFADGSVCISTARAGNVIGGGDFAQDRILPDCIRAAEKGIPVVVRNPHSTRPFQHVIEPLFAYLMIARKQYEDASFAGFYNVGPDDRDCVTTGEIVDLFCEAWGEGMMWENHHVGGPHEAGFLKLDCSLIKAKFGWSPRWDISEAVRRTVEWTHAWMSGEDIATCMQEQISAWRDA